MKPVSRPRWGSRELSPREQATPIQNEIRAPSRSERGCWRRKKRASGVVASLAAWRAACAASSAMSCRDDSLMARPYARQVNAAISKHVRARDLAITMVSTAATMKKLLLAAKIKESAIDVVGFESQ